MKLIIILILALFLISIVSASSSNSDNFQLKAFFGNGGITNENLNVYGGNVSLGFSQFIIGNNTAGTVQADLGLFYIGTINNIAIIPISNIFKFLIKQIGLEYVRLNWTG